MAQRERALPRLAERQRIKRGEMMREEIIDAALTEFAERGYHQTSIADIAERLGSGHSLFYRYFQNKRDILDHAIRGSTARTASTIAEVSAGPITSMDEFSDFAERLGLALMKTLCEDPRLYRLLVLQSASVDLEMTQQFCQGFDAGSAVLAELLRSGIEAKYIRPDIDIEATADSIVGIPFGLLARYGHRPDNAMLAARVQATVALVRRGIESDTGRTAAHQDGGA